MDATNTNKRIYFYVDGNSVIATGHLMRCLTIARTCRELGAKGPLSPIFAVSDSESARMLSNKMVDPDEFPILILESDYSDPISAIPALRALLEKAGPKNCTLFVDSYYVTSSFFDEFEDFVNLVYLDDLKAFDYHVDTLFNYDPICDYSHFHWPTVRYTGTIYAPLRPIFAKLYSEVKITSDLQDILIVSGGLGIGKGIAALARVLVMETSARIHVITSDPAALKKKICTGRNFPEKRLYLHSYIEDLPYFLLEMDLVFSAAGTTLYELCAMGIPSISITVADNQLPGAKAFDSLGIVPYLGDFRKVRKFNKKKLLALLTTYSTPEARTAAHQRMHEAVDGNGAERIAKILMGLA